MSTRALRPDASSSAIPDDDGEAGVDGATEGVDDAAYETSDDDNAETPPPPPPPRPPPVAIRQFPCESCGARLEFSPGTRTMTCPYCGHQNALPPDPAEAARSAVEELDFDTYVALAEAHAAEGGGEVEQTVAHCRGCGADITLPPNVAADSCPYCARPVVLGDAVKEKIRVQALLPFTVTRERAETAWRDWLGGLWFAPSRLKKLADKTGQLTGLYLPYWTFDSDTDTVYQGARGDYYYVSVSYTVTVNGKPQRRTRQERRTRWTPKSGRVTRFFDDVLVPASGVWSAAMLDRLEPWDLAQLEAYRPEFLSGFRAEKFGLGLAPGFGRAREKMTPVIRADVQRDIGGDTQRIHTLHTDHRTVTFKHVLLPLWTSAYRFKQKTYHFYVNARSGEVAGERPWSAWKITLFALVMAAILCGLIRWVAGTGVFDNVEFSRHTPPSTETVDLPARHAFPFAPPSKT